MVKVLQLSVEVGKCWLPEDQLQSKLDYVLTVELTNELASATSIKTPQKGVLDFGTRLFIRLNTLPLDRIPTCLIVLSSIDPSGIRSKIAVGQFVAKSEGLSQFRLSSSYSEAVAYRVELQFGSSVVEAKQNRSKINISNSFKSRKSQKQSSWQQNERSMKKSSSNFHSTGTLDRYDSKQSLEMFQRDDEFSEQENRKSSRKEEFEASMAQSKTENKAEESVSKTQDTATHLQYHLKIDELEEKLTEISQKLTKCNRELEQAADCLKQETSKSKRLELQNRELGQLLELQELKSRIASEHAARLNLLIETMNKEEKGEFELIEEKDEIIMLNQELETELSNKLLIITELKGEIGTLKDKIVGMEVKMTPLVSVVSAQPSNPVKKLESLPGKELEKIKSEKRLADRRNPTWNKKQEDLTKETNSSKEVKAKAREVHRPVVKKEREVKIPVRGKAPMSHKNQIAPVPRVQKGRPSKLPKPESKLPSTEKKSMESSFNTLNHELDNMHQPTNLMLNSRMVDSEPPKTETS